MKISKTVGLVARFYLAMLAIFAPKMLMASVIKGFLDSVSMLSNEELKRLLKDLS